MPANVAIAYSAGTEYLIRPSIRRILLHTSLCLSSVRGMEAGMHSDNISCSIGTWHVQEVFSRHRASATRCFKAALRMTSNLSSSNRSRHRPSFLVQSVRFRIRFSTSWSVQTVNWHLSKRDRVGNTACTTANHSQRVLNYARSTVFKELDQHLTSLLVPSGCFCSRT